MISDHHYLLKLLCCVWWKIAALQTNCIKLYSFSLNVFCLFFSSSQNKLVHIDLTMVFQPLTVRIALSDHPFHFHEIVFVVS